MDWPIPPPEAERQVGGSQSWKAKSNLIPRDGILHQTKGRLPVAKSSWDPGRLISTRTVAVRDQLLRGDIRHT